MRLRWLRQRGRSLVKRRRRRPGLVAAQIWQLGRGCACASRRWGVVVVESWVFCGRSARPPQRLLRALRRVSGRAVAGGWSTAHGIFSLALVLTTKRGVTATANCRRFNESVLGRPRWQVSCTPPLAGVLFKHRPHSTKPGVRFLGSLTTVPTAAARPRTTAATEHTGIRVSSSGQVRLGTTTHSTSCAHIRLQRNDMEPSLPMQHLLHTLQGTGTLRT